MGGLGGAGFGASNVSLFPCCTYGFRAERSQFAYHLFILGCKDASPVKCTLIAMCTLTEKTNKKIMLI